MPCLDTVSGWLPDGLWFCQSTAMMAAIMPWDAAGQACLTPALSVPVPRVERAVVKRRRPGRAGVPVGRVVGPRTCPREAKRWQEAGQHASRKL